MNFAEILLAIAVGIGGYLATNFWMAPVLKYVQAKKKVVKDITYYGNVLGNDNLNEAGQEHRRQGRDAIREDAAELLSCYSLLPWWYRKYLDIVNEDPKDATKGLIGLSNSDDFNTSMQFTKQATKALRLRED